MTRTIFLTLTVLAFGSGACAGFHPRPAAPRPESVRHERVLLRSEIAAQDVRTAYEAVVRLRPEFLTWTRGAETTSGPLGVYIDGMRASLDRLQTIPAASVREIRLLRASEATFGYGEGNQAAALDVRTGAPD